jgi:riboflavin synthase
MQFDVSGLYFEQKKCHKMSILKCYLKNIIIKIVTYIYINLHVFIHSYESKNDEKLKITYLNSSF